MLISLASQRRDDAATLCDVLGFAVVEIPTRRSKAKASCGLQMQKLFLSSSKYSGAVGGVPLVISSLPIKSPVSH